jgi:hypothetical protein
LPNLVDMSAMNELAVAWAVSAAGILFLALSGWHNRRSGYQRKRVEESGIDDALGWLAEFRASLSPDDAAAAPVASLTSSRPEILNQH